MNSCLSSIKASRRELAITIFEGSHLQYAEVRHLSNEFAAADEAVREFLNWLTAQFPVEAAALICTGSEVRAREFLEIAEQLLKKAGATVRRVSQPELLNAFAVPALGNQQQLRATAIQIWPQLNSSRLSRSVLDAAAAGLYVQVERLLNS